MPSGGTPYLQRTSSRRRLPPQSLSLKGGFASEHATFVGREHLDEHAHHAARRVELPAVLALGRGELGEEVFVDAAEDVARAVGLVAETDGADQVDELAEARFVERGPAIVLWQNTLERGVVALDRDHRVIDELADRGLRGAPL